MMTRDHWFANLTEKLEHEFDYRLEWLIMNLTEDICRRMETLKINRTQLARKLSITPAAVSKILNGNSNFTLRTLLSLSDALDGNLKIDFGELLVDAIVSTPLLKTAPESYFYESTADFKDIGIYSIGGGSKIIPFRSHAGSAGQQGLATSATQ